MDKENLNAFARCLLFKEIKEEDLEAMLMCINPKMRKYKKNDLICIAGEEFDGIGIVISGEAVVTQENSEGNRVIIAILKPGDMFGEMAAFSGNRKWPATVYAQGNCTVAFIPPEKIVGECSRLCVGHRKLIVNMLTIVSKKALMLNRKVEYLALKNMKGKIAKYLLEQYKLNGKLTFKLLMNRNELADFLNVARPSLSRELCNMRDEGIIDFDRSAIKILNLQALKNLEY